MPKRTQFGGGIGTNRVDLKVQGTTVASIANKRFHIIILVFKLDELHVWVLVLL